MALTGQPDLFADPEDVAEEAFPASTESNSNRTIAAARGDCSLGSSTLAAPQAQPVSTDERHEGWSNSATFLASMYIDQDARRCAQVQALVDDACIIDVGKLSKLFKVSVASAESADRDDYMTGFTATGELVLDFWAKGLVNWREIAAAFVEDQRRELGVTMVDDAVMHAIGTATVDGLVIRLNTGQLPRDVYTKVDRLLRMLGGRWQKKLGGHVFESDPTEAYEAFLATGQIDKADNFGAFFTPPALADDTIALADLLPGHSFLEPNAGGGALLTRAAAIVGVENCVAVELQSKHAAALADQGFRVHEGDFLSRPNWHPTGGLFDRIVMNPPFAAQADIDNVMHAYSMLVPGGRLVSIMSGGVQYRTNRKTLAFRELLAEVGSLKPNPDGSFKESGTLVRTVTVVLTRPHI